jgi:hypothetical protein
VANMVVDVVVAAERTAVGVAILMEAADQVVMAMAVATSRGMNFATAGRKGTRPMSAGRRRRMSRRTQQRWRTTVKLSCWSPALTSTLSRRRHH